MPDPTVVQEIVIEAPAKEVWPYIATGAGLSRWWGSDVQMEPHVGGRVTERTYQGGEEVVQHGRVMAFEPPHRIMLTFAPWPRPNAPAPESGWMLSRIVISLKEKEGRTSVLVWHQLFDAAALGTRGGLSVLPVPSGPTMQLGRGALSAQPQPGTVRSPALTQFLRQKQWAHRLEMLATSVYAAMPV